MAQAPWKARSANFVPIRQEHPPVLSEASLRRQGESHIAPSAIVEVAPIVGVATGAPNADPVHSHPGSDISASAEVSDGLPEVCFDEPRPDSCSGDCITGTGHVGDEWQSSYGEELIGGNSCGDRIDLGTIADAFDEFPAHGTIDRGGATANSTYLNASRPLSTTFHLDRAAGAPTANGSRAGGAVDEAAASLGPSSRGMAPQPLDVLEGGPEYDRIGSGAWSDLLGTGEPAAAGADASSEEGRDLLYSGGGSDDLSCDVADDRLGD